MCHLGIQFSSQHRRRSSPLSFARSTNGGRGQDLKKGTSKIRYGLFHPIGLLSPLSPALPYPDLGNLLLDTACRLKSPCFLRGRYQLSGGAVESHPEFIPEESAVIG